MCSMCPRLGLPGRTFGEFLPWAGDQDCHFVDWTTEETGWIVNSTNEPAGIAEEREEVEFGESEEVDDSWIRWSDDVASWPDPKEWAIDAHGELPDWLVEMEGFSVQVPEDDPFAVDVLAPEEALAGAT